MLGHSLAAAAAARADKKARPELEGFRYFAVHSVGEEVEGVLAEFLRGNKSRGYRARTGLSLEHRIIADHGYILGNADTALFKSLAESDSHLVICTRNGVRKLFPVREELLSALLAALIPEIAVYDAVIGDGKPRLVHGVAVRLKALLRVLMPLFACKKGDIPTSVDIYQVRYELENGGIAVGADAREELALLLDNDYGLVEDVLQPQLKLFRGISGLNAVLEYYRAVEFFGVHKAEYI